MEKKHYIIIAGVAVVLIVLVWWLWPKSKNPDAEFGIAKDYQGWYGIGNNSISRYSKKGVRKMIRKFKCPIYGAKIINGDLVVHTKKSILWLDRNTLKGVDFMNVPFIKGHIAWLDYHDNKWWVCDTFTGKPQKTKLYCFDDDWNIIGLWRFPMKGNILGGCFAEKTLYILSDNHMYHVSLPEDEINVNILSVLPKMIDGNNFSIELDGKKTRLWGTSAGKIVKVLVNVDDDDEKDKESTQDDE